MKRRVRVLDDVFDQLGQQLPGERGSDRTPSVADFVRTDLVEIHAIFADRWDDLPCPVPGRTDYRQVIGKGSYVATFAATGQLAPDGSIELTRVTVQLSWPDDVPD